MHCPRIDHLTVGFLFVALTLCTAVPTFGQGTYTMRVDSGWNLISLPTGVTNVTKDSLFPAAISAAYIYTPPAGYQVLDTLRSGPGFWLKFGVPQTLLLPGDLIGRDTIDVHAGWNLIGSLSFPVTLDSVRTNPAGMVASQFFRYLPGEGYQQADTLSPGNGHWVKVSGEGNMVLSSRAGLPCPGRPTVLYMGKTYNTVQIGSQCWLRENLDVGAMVPGSQEQTSNGILEKYCYGNDTANCDLYGGLYQWDEAMQYDTTQGARGICPPGWHIPTFAEFHALVTGVGWNGNPLKQVGQGTGNGAGTNTTGFSGLLAGYRYADGLFYDLGAFGHFWSSRHESATLARYLVLFSTHSGIGLNSFEKTYGYNVRCLAD